MKTTILNFKNERGNAREKIKKQIFINAVKYVYIQ